MTYQRPSPHEPQAGDSSPEGNRTAAPEDLGPYARCAVALLADSHDVAVLLTPGASVHWANRALWAHLKGDEVGTDLAVLHSVAPDARAEFIAAVARACDAPLLSTRHVIVPFSNGLHAAATVVTLTPIETTPRSLVLARFEISGARLKRAATIESTLRRVTAELALLARDEQGGTKKSANIPSPLCRLPTDMPSRQREVAQLILRGVDVDEIGERLGLSPYTVRNHLKAVFRRVGVHSRAELLARFDA